MKAHISTEDALALYDSLLDGGYEDSQAISTLEAQYELGSSFYAEVGANDPNADEDEEEEETPMPLPETVDVPSDETLAEDALHQALFDQAMRTGGMNASSRQPAPRNVSVRQPMGTFSKFSEALVGRDPLGRRHDVTWGDLQLIKPSNTPEKEKAMSGTSVTKLMFNELLKSVDGAFKEAKTVNQAIGIAAARGVPVTIGSAPTAQMDPAYGDYTVVLEDGILNRCTLALGQSILFSVHSKGDTRDYYFILNVN